MIKVKGIVNLNGIHLEAMPLTLTECVGYNVHPDQIGDHYTTLCDPRLNFQQTKKLLQDILPSMV